MLTPPSSPNSSAAPGTVSQSIERRMSTSCVLAAQSVAPEPVSSRAEVARTVGDSAAGGERIEVRAGTAPASASGVASEGSYLRQSISKRREPT
eukprot:scaffold121957_cov28-Tisochrysis_lutea.AAC.5